MSKKLDTEEKLSIALSRIKSLRDLAGEYNVHHSTIDEIFKESEKILREYWQEKSERRGRPSKAKDEQKEELSKSEQEKAVLEKQLALKQMRIEYLELKLKWEREHAEQAQQKRKKHLKKKKK
jgi:IS30 family transposase